MHRNQDSAPWTFVAFLILFSPCCSHANESEEEILIMGQVRHPRRVLLSKPIDFVEAVRKVDGLHPLADMSRAHIYFDQKHSAIQYLVVDIEKLIRSGSRISLEHISTIRIPEILIGFPGHESYERAKRRLKLSEAEARAKIVEGMKDSAATEVPTLPKIIVGHFYWFTNSERSYPSPGGWYVNGITGDIRDFYWDRTLFGQPYFSK